MSSTECSYVAFSLLKTKNPCQTSFTLVVLSSGCFLHLVVLKHSGYVYVLSCFRDDKVLSI